MWKRWNPIENATFETEEETATADNEVNAEADGDESEAYEPYFVDNFALTKLDGTEVSLMDYDNEIIILNFWATWCQYSYQRDAIIRWNGSTRWHNGFGRQCGRRKKLVEDYIAENGYEFEVFLDEDSTLASTFGVTGFPTSVFMGKNLELYYVYPGMLDETTFDAILEAIDDIKAKNVK